MKSQSRKPTPPKPKITLTLSQAEFDATIKAAQDFGLDDPAQFLWLALHSYLATSNNDDSELRAMDFEALRDRFFFNEIPHWAIQSEESQAA